MLNTLASESTANAAAISARPSRVLIRNSHTGVSWPESVNGGAVIAYEPISASRSSRRSSLIAAGSMLWQFANVTVTR